MKKLEFDVTIYREKPESSIYTKIKAHSMTDAKQLAESMYGGPGVRVTVT